MTWWGGIALLVAAVVLFYAELALPTVYVLIAAAGLILCIAALIMELHDTGLTASVINGLASCLALMFGVFGFFFHQRADWVLFVAFGGFLLFVFIAMFAEFYEKGGELKRAVRRWIAHRRG